MSSAVRVMSAAFATLSLTSGCAFLRPVRVPVPTTRYAEPRDGGQCMVIYLPGRRNTPRAFSVAGLPRLAEEAGVRAAQVGVDAHMRYYMKGQVLIRLHDDVVAPARAAGVKRIVLVGVSMGGLGALLYAREHPGEVSGIVLLSPFLGYDGIVREVRGAGGLAAWTPPERIAADDFQNAVWQFVKQVGRPDSPVPPLVLAHGTRDSMEPAHTLLAEVLPPERVLATDGGHDWRTWRALWQRVLATGVVQRWCEDGEQP